MKEKDISTSGEDYSRAIKHWPRDDRPREKLFKKGEHSLSNSELLAILLRTGSKGQSAVDLARDILRKFGTFRGMSHIDLSDWRDFKGLGRAKIAQIKAAVEIGRRFSEVEISPRKDKLNSAGAVNTLFSRMRDLKKEVFKVALLDAKNNLLDVVEISQGTVNHVFPIIREIFQIALEKFSSSIICVHNHPSGDPSPSREDISFTRQLHKCAGIMQINLLDHVIIGDNTYYSFADEGMI